MRVERVMAVAVGFVACAALAAPGQWKQLGKDRDFAASKVLTSLAGKLYSVEKNGQMFAIDASNGSWKEVGKGEYAKTKFFVGVAGKLLSIESDGNGQMFAIEPSDGSYKEIGKGDFGKARLLTSAGDSVYSIETDGTLFQIATK